MKKESTPALAEASTGPSPDAARLAEAFAVFSRASEELSSAYNALQAQVSQLTERLDVLLGVLPAGVVILDREGRVAQLNRAAETLLGAGLAGESWAIAASRFAPTGTPGEVTLGGGAGVRRLVLSETALESGEGRIVLLHDVTEPHRMRVQAERNERLAAMGEMVAGLAHQLRTPLAAALLYVGNLRAPELPPEQRGKLADRAIERLRHLERLIRDMLLFARGDSLGRERFAVDALVGEVAQNLQPLARTRGLAFESQCDCGDRMLFGDRKALGGAVANLVENAIQATDAGGAVAVRVEDDDVALRFRVVDTGCGIEPQDEARLFDPFFTTRAEGTGLGLAIARGVARAHGGDIAVESMPGRGSVFTLHVPLVADAPITETEGSG